MNSTLLGRVQFNDCEAEGHVGSPLPSILVEPIGNSSGLSRLEWVNLEMVLLNDSGDPVVEGIYRSTHPHNCVDQNHLAMRMLVLSSFRPSFILWCIPLKGYCFVDGHVMLEGVSLCDHEQRHMQIQEELQANMSSCKGLHKYDSLARVACISNECKCQKLFT